MREVDGSSYDNVICTSGDARRNLYRIERRKFSSLLHCEMAFCAAPLSILGRTRSNIVATNSPTTRCSMKDGTTRRAFLSWATSSAVICGVPWTAASRPVFVKDEDSGISYYDTKVGTGASPLDGDYVAIDYVAFLSSGEIFDSRKNFVFQYGKVQVVPGLEAAVSSMRVGGERKAVLPPDTAYGSKGVCLATKECLVPPNETLGYDITLIRVAVPPI